MNSSARIICGIDPGLRRTGYGVVRADGSGLRFEVLDAGLIKAKATGALSARLVEIADGLAEVLEEYRVETVAVEQIYSHYQRPRTAILMAHARGVILLEAARRRIEVLHLPSTTVKRHLTGNGRADKSQMQRAVMHTLSLPRLPEPPDVADALAIALCAGSMIHHPERQALTTERVDRGDE